MAAKEKGFALVSRRQYEVMEPHAQGFVAFEEDGKGEISRECPYPVGTVKAVAWYEGAALAIALQDEAQIRKRRL